MLVLVALSLLFVAGTATEASQDLLSDYNACYPHCRNGGTCYTSRIFLGPGFCRCTPGYEGTDCSVYSGQATTAPPRYPPKLGNSRCRFNTDCLNGGTCFDGFCQCTRFYFGVNCRQEQERPPTQGPACPHTCVNGQCDLTLGRCSCRPGYVGHNCSTQSGHCTFHVWQRFCTCNPGYTDHNCHTPVTCQHLSTILAYGSVTVSADQSSGTVPYATTASYSCNSGYVLQGKSERHCQAEGTWSGRQPTCAPPPTTRPPHISCGQGCGRGTCDIKTGRCQCWHGYAGEFCQTKSGNCGQSSKTNWRYTCVCLPGYSGQYCNQHVTCSRLSTTLSYGTVVVSADQSSGKVPYDSTAHYSCRAGYDLQGESPRRCSADGSWSGSAPTCVRRPPSTTQAPVCPGGCGNGYCDYSAGSCQCFPGYFGPNCAIPSGRCVRSPHSFQYVCTCKAGFTGQFCGARQRCPRLSTSFNYGVVTVSADQSSGYVAYGIIATYRCNSGYVLHGNGTRQCQHDGTWSGTVPRCSLPPTQPPAKPCNPPCTHGNCDTTTGKCRCHRGYFGHDCSVRSGRCYQTGKGYVCTCFHGYRGQYCDMRVRCHSIPGTLLHGTVQFSNRPVNGLYPYRASAKYSCNSGYVLRGNTHRYCSHDGSWNGTAPSCAPAPTTPKPTLCAALSPPANGRVQQQVYKVTTLLIFSCNPGYRLSGSVARICLGGGRWSGSVAECTPIVCPTPPHIQFGVRTGNQYTYGSVVSYRCYGGYYLVGSQELRCLVDGQWSSSAPTCQRQAVQQCCLLDAVPFTNIISGQGSRHIGARVTYACLPGYTLRGGDAIRTCQSNGAWSGAPPRCEKLACPDPGVVENAQRTVSDAQFSISSTVTYTCNAGYALAGASQLECSYSRSWSAPLPRCVQQATCDGRFDVNQTVYLSPRQNQPLAADILLVVEETLDLVEEFRWLRRIVLTIESNLTGMGIGTDPSLRNLYTLVGYGRSMASGQSCVNRLVPTDNTNTTFTADLFNSAAARLVPDWGLAASRDAYSAISFGVRNAPLRYGPNIAHNLILLTVSDRGIPCEPAVTLTRAMLRVKMELLKNGFLANFIVNHPLQAGFDKEEDVFAVRVDRRTNTLSAVLRNKASVLRKVSNAFVNFTASGLGNTNRDYTQLALEVGGVVWNVNMIDTGSVAVQNAFNHAFSTVKATEIFLQAKSCKVCECLASGGLRCRLIRDQAACRVRCLQQTVPVDPRADCGPIPQLPPMCVGDSVCNF